MKILSIETSCDDTAISILEATGGIANASFKVLANNSNSQINIHIPYGGVYPMLAKREHIKNLPILLEKTLGEANLTPPQPLPKGEGQASFSLGKAGNKVIDLITVTYGPGLEMCLWEGIIFAKELAEKWSVPLIPVNHMEGHIFSVFGKSDGNFKIPLRRLGCGGQAKIKNPMLALLVSGGHTQLILIKKSMRYEIIGETLDDAVGEAFDKVARMLDLPYPGGPQISRLAEEERKRIIPLLRGAPTLQSRSGVEKLSTSPAKAGTPQEENLKFALPRPMLYTKNFNFSFSGLKTAVLYLIKDLGGIEKLDEKIKAQIALEFEKAAIECLVHKTAKAIEKYKIKTLIIAGGVSANKHLQNEMEKMAGKKVKLFFPPKELTGDNAIMIGIAGYLNYIKNKNKITKIDNIKAVGNLRL